MRKSLSAPIVECAASKLERHNERENLLDLVAMALPYVEEAANDPAYKPGALAPLIKRMRAAVS